MNRNLLSNLLGLDQSAADLSFFQVLARTVVIFVSGLIMVRVADKRFFAKKAAFDVLMAFIIGSILGRAINGSEKLFSTIGACFLLVYLHRGVAFLANRSERFGNWVKGSSNLLVEDGKVIEQALRKHHISEADVAEDMRLKSAGTDLSELREARLERSGDISFVRKK